MTRHKPGPSAGAGRPLAHAPSIPSSGARKAREVAGAGTSWTINSTATTDLTVTIVASTGIPTFDRTTTPILIRGGIVGTPISFDLYEIEFPTIVAGSATATAVSGTLSRPTVGGDSPQQPGGSTGTLSCTWSLTFR